MRNIEEDGAAVRQGPIDADELALLKRRARELAAQTEDLVEYSDEQELLTVRVGGDHYAISLQALISVAPLGALTPLPGAPAYVAGIAHLQGQVVTVVDLGELLTGRATSLKAALLVAVGHEQMAVAVDAYETVQQFADDAFLTKPSGGSGDKLHACLKGVTASGIGLLDMSCLLDELMARAGQPTESEL